MIIVPVRRQREDITQTGCGKDLSFDDSVKLVQLGTAQLERLAKYYRIMNWVQQSIQKKTPGLTLNNYISSYGKVRKGEVQKNLNLDDTDTLYVFDGLCIDGTRRLRPTESWVAPQGRLSSQNLEGVVTRFIDSNKQAIDLLEKLDFECDCYSRNIPDYVLYVDFRGKLDRDYQHLLQGPICGNNSAKLIIEDVNKKKYKNCGFTHELYETDEFEPVLRLLVQFKEPSQVNVDSLKNLVEYVRKKEYSVAKEDIR